MNVKVEAVTAKNRAVDGSQDTGIAHAIPTEVIQICQQCVAKAEVCAKDLHRRAKKLRCEDVRAAPAMISTTPESWRYRKLPMNFPSCDETFNTEPVFNK